MPHPGFIVRTVTSFLALEQPVSRDGVLARVRAAAAFNVVAAAAISKLGYLVQTQRVVLPPLGEWLLPLAGSEPARQLELVEAVRAAILEAAGARQRLHIGAATSAEELCFVPALISAFDDVSSCVNIEADELGMTDHALALAAAGAINAISRESAGGGGCFSFCANFAVKPGTPYFPAAYAAPSTAEGTFQGITFTVGFQHIDACVAALEGLGADWAAAVRVPATRNASLAKGAAAMQALLIENTAAVVDVCKGLAVSSTPCPVPVAFGGVDTSIAPLPDAKPVTELYTLLGVNPGIGASGSLEVSALLTRVCKAVVPAVGVPGVGYCGLMLAPLEDTGLSAAAGRYSITELLSYSAVCGIGLDTVPIPFAIPDARLAALIADVGTLAFRLSKPLSARLFPVPGVPEEAFVPGKVAAFDNPNLCPCPIFAVP